MTEIAESDPKSLILVDRGHGAVESAHERRRSSSELARRLQGQSPALALPLTWIEQRLAESNRTDRAAGAVGKPAAGCRSGLDQQQHRQPALARRDGLARVRRDNERRRADIAAGSRRRLRPRWISPRATATGTSSRRLAKTGSMSEGAGGRRRDQARSVKAPAMSSGDDRAAHVGFLSDRRGTAEARAQSRAGSPDAIAEHLARRPRASAFYYLGAIALITASLAGGAASQGVRRRRARMAAGRGGHPRADRVESGGRRAGQLDGARCS